MERLPYPPPCGALKITILKSNCTNKLTRECPGTSHTWDHKEVKIREFYENIV